MSDHPPNLSHARRRFSPTAARALILFTVVFNAASCSTQNEPPPSAPREFPPIVSTAPANSPAASASVASITASAHVAQDVESNSVLFDYRKDKALARPELSFEELRRIYVAAYGEGYEKFEPLIRSAAEGVFTGAGARQIAYLIQPNNTGEALDADAAPGANLVIFEGARMVANVAVGGNKFIRRVNHYASILRLSDLDGDGINELLLGASYLNRGINLSWARLVEVREGKLKLIRDFGVIDEDTCDGERQMRVTSGVIRAATTEKGRGWPRFKVDFYRAPCPAGGDERDPSQFRPSAAPR